MNHIASLRGHTFLQNLVTKFSVCLDLGANKGEFSSLVSDKFGCQCYAIEASPKMCDLIPNNQLIQVFNYAITNSSNLIEFNLADLDEASSIKQIKESTTEQIVTVQGITLEDFLNLHKLTLIDLLKVDIEGAEIELFNSTSDATLQQIKQITIEFHDFKDKKCDYIMIEVSDPNLRKAGSSSEELIYFLQEYNCQIFKIGLMGIKPFKDSYQGLNTNLIVKML